MNLTQQVEVGILFFTHIVFLSVGQSWGFGQRNISENTQLNFITLCSYEEQNV